MKLEPGQIVRVTYHDLAGSANGSADDADLEWDGEYVGFFVRWSRRKGKRVLVCASVRWPDGRYEAWATWPAATVDEISIIKTRRQ